MVAVAGTTPAASRLPALRQELALVGGPMAADGAPTWTLHDPGDNRFFQLSWSAFEILSRWSLADAAALIHAVNTETTLQIGLEDLEGVLLFLQQHNLLQASTREDSERLARQAGARRLGPLKWLVHHYLFFRIPLLHPMPFLQRMAPYVDGFFSRRFLYLVLGVAVLGLYLVSQQWEQFVHTFAAYADWQGALNIAIALSFAKVLHELGHAFAAHRQGCRVPSMGIAFLVMWPVLYTDTNEGWKLSSRRARLQIGAAGMGAEISLAAFATLAWSFLPDGPVRAAAFLLATSTWLATLAINLSPFMRFDGYFLLSDFLGVPNLHERSFALGRWRMREWLFGLGEDAPERFPLARQRFLIAFAYVTWLYRLVVFLSIALLVYHFFFKLLGIVLLGVELGVFIALPVWREVRQWYLLRASLCWNPATRRSFALLLLGLGILLLPWQASLRVPAVALASQAQALYAPAPAQIVVLHVRSGQMVKKDQILLELRAPELEYQLGMARAREHALRWQLDQQNLDLRLQNGGQALGERWQAAQHELDGVLAQQALLTLKAPFDGRVISNETMGGAGSWVVRGEALLTVVNPEGIKVEAMLEEDDLSRLRDHQGASFVANQPDLPSVTCSAVQADPINLANIEHAALASPFGGPIPARIEHTGRMLPLKTVFRVRLENCQGWPGVAKETLGVAHIAAQRESLLGRAWRAMLAIGQREMTLQ